MEKDGKTLADHYLESQTNPGTEKIYILGYKLQTVKG